MPNDTGEYAVPDGGLRLLAVTDDPSYPVSFIVNPGSDGATLNEVGAVGKAHEAGRVICCCCYFARDAQVLDGGVLDVVEWRHTSLTATDVHIQLMPIADEGALEGVDLVHAHHRRYCDILGHLYVLPFVGAAAVYVVPQFLPVFRAAEDIGVVGRACAFGRPVGKVFCLDVYNAVRHLEPIALFTVSVLIGNLIAIGIRDGETRQLARGDGQRDGLARPPAQNAFLPSGTGLDGTRPGAADVHHVWVFVGKAKHGPATAAAVDVSFEYVRYIRTSSILVAHKFVVIVVF